MKEPTPLGADLGEQMNQILARRGLDPEQPAGEYEEKALADLRAEQMRLTVERTRSHTPARYRDADATDEAVRAWTGHLVSATIAQHGPPPLRQLTLGQSLLILGPTGVGKTHQAYAAIQAIAAAGISVKWQAGSAADLYARMRPRAGADSQNSFTEIAGAPLLLVDDLGAAKGSEWTEEITYRLINHRYEHMLPTLITSNVPPGELKEALGDRVASRLAEMCERVTLRGQDRRRAS